MPLQVAAVHHIEYFVDLLVDTVALAQQSESLNEVLERYRLSLLALQILYEPVNSVAPNAGQRTKLRKSLVVNARLRLRLQSQALVQLVDKLYFFNRKRLKDELLLLTFVKQRKVVMHLLRISLFISHIL